MRGEVKPTNLEKRVMDVLDALEIKYVFQYPTRTGYVIDFAIFPEDQTSPNPTRPYHTATKSNLTPPDLASPYRTDLRVQAFIDKLFDLLRQGRKIAIEVDGPTHDSPEAKKRDRFKDYMLKREGWTVIRINWRELEE